MHPTLKASAALALLSSHTPAYAQEAFDLGEITLFSSSVQTELDKTGTTTEVLSEDNIRRGGTQQVVTQVAQLPGVNFAGNGPVGASQVMSVRGLPSKYVPVFIEGIDMTDTTGTQNIFNWGGILNSGLGRVEVLKGSQSALYGSEAVGGVVNIAAARLTEEGERYTFGAEVGSYNTKSASFNYLRKTERADISFSLSRLTSDGFSSAEENAGNTERDGFEGTNALLSASFEATEALTLGATLFYSDTLTNIEESDQAQSFMVVDADIPYYNTRKAARVFAKIDGEVVDHEFGLSVATNHSREPSSIYTKSFKGTRRSVDYKATSELGAGTATLGFVRTTEVAQLDAARNEVDTSAVFSEILTPLSANVDLSVAGRYENHSTFGKAVTGRAALAWRVAEDTVIRASFGNGVRAPSIYELFDVYAGNQNLEEESSTSFDLGIEHSYASGSKIKAVVFYNEIDNLIDYDLGTYTYNQTPGQSITKGLELSGEVLLSNGVSLTGAYTYTDSADASGAQLRRVPTHDILLGVNADISSQLSIGLSAQHVAGRADDGDPLRAMPDYTVANATLNYSLSDTSELYMRVENLFDKEYQMSGGYGTSDRALYFGVRASF
jgi:vitamin B12 transporter